MRSAALPSPANCRLLRHDLHRALAPHMILFAPAPFGMGEGDLCICHVDMFECVCTVPVYDARSNEHGGVSEQHSCLHIE